MDSIAQRSGPGTPRERTESHPLMPSENLAQSMSPLFPLNPVLIALHLTAYLFMAKSRTELQCLSRRKKIPRGR